MRFFLRLLGERMKDSISRIIEKPSKKGKKSNSAEDLDLIVTTS